MATSPAPDAAAPPGMCPGIAVLGGGGAGGDGDGSGNGGKDGAGGDGNGNGENGSGDGKGGGACGQGSAGGCPQHSAHASAGDPVNVANGEMFTIPKLEFGLPGLIAIEFERTYNTSHRDRDVGMGFGWGHSFAWEAELKRRDLSVRKGIGGGVKLLDAPTQAGEARLLGGWRIQRTREGFSVRTVDGFDHDLAAIADNPRRFRLTRVAHPNGAEISLLRGSSGVLERIIDTVGREICFTSNRAGRITQIHLTEPTTGRGIIYARYEYDPVGNLVASTDADGSVTLYRYDDDHRITSLVHPNGLTFHYRYDALSRCVETWGELPDGDPSLDPSVPDVLADHTTRARGIFHTKLEFDANYTEVVDSVRLLRYFVAPNGIIQKAVGAKGDVYTREFDERGNVIALMDAQGAVTRYEYDSHDRLVCETEPLGRSHRTHRDVEGRPVSTIDFGGAMVRCRYDDRGNMVEVTDQINATTTYHFDDRNLMVQKTDPDRGVTRYVSDAHGNMIELHMPSGGVWRWTWDYFGRPVERVDPRGGVTRYSYSDAGKLIGLEEPGGRRVKFEWDGMGCYTAWYVPEGVRGWRWGAFRWPVAEIQPNGDTVRYTYNREGWLVSVINERGETARYEYDTAGLITRSIRFDGTWETYKRDIMRRVVGIKTSASEELEYEYDLAGRLTAIKFPDDTECRCEYNDTDDVIRATGPGVVVEQHFDEAGNAVFQSQELGGVKHVVRAGYDAMHRYVDVESSLGLGYHVDRAVGGAVRTFSLSASERIAIDSDPAGFPIAENLPGGGRIELDWDERVRLRMLRVAAPRAAAEMGTPAWVGGQRFELAARYEYRQDDKLTRSRYADYGVTDYEYDARGRLAGRAPEQGTHEAFRFDETNNLFDARSPGKRTFEAGNRLVKDGDTIYHWDDAGRLVAKQRSVGSEVQTTRYAWNGQGLLSMVVLPDDTQIEFTYDPFLRRLEKVVFRPDGEGHLLTTRRVRYVWDGNLLLHELILTCESDGSLAQEKRTFTRLQSASRFLAIGHVTGKDAFHQPEAWTYCASDALATPVALVDGRGKVMARRSLTAWGKVEREEGELPLPGVFAGQSLDEETGLVYNFNRYYDPEIGRYISPDPIDLGGGLNLYAYCPDPVNYCDPWGLEDDDLNDKHHKCSASFQPGGSKTTYTPNSDSGYMGPKGNPVPGTQSGAKSNDSELRGSNNQRMIPGANGSNGTSLPAPGKPYSNTTQPTCHTEMHAMEWAKTHFPNDIPGSKMKLGGQNPPCNNCNNNMRDFTNTKPPATIEYNWPVNNKVKYHGGQGPTAVPNGKGMPVGAEATALQNAPNYHNEYLDQNKARRNNPALADRTHHVDENAKKY